MNLAMNIAYENQLQRNGVRVNAVCPGPVATALAEPIYAAIKEAQQPFAGLPGYGVVNIGSPEGISRSPSYLQMKICS